MSVPRTQRTMDKKCELVCSLQEQIKKTYAAIDALLAEIAAAQANRDESSDVAIADEYIFTDNWTDALDSSKSVVFSPAAFHRYTLKRR